MAPERRLRVTGNPAVPFVRKDIPSRLQVGAPARRDSATVVVARSTRGDSAVELLLALPASFVVRLHASGKTR